MPPEVPIEQRLSAIEEAIAELQRRLPPPEPEPTPEPTKSWLDKIAGSFAGEPGFDEVIAYGRACRASCPFPEDEDGA